VTKDEALRLARDALEDIGDEWGFTSQRTVPKRKEAITAIKEALAQTEKDGECKHCTDGCPACDARKLPEQKPLAWYDPTNGAVSTDKDSPLFTPLGQLLPLYTKQEDDGITLTTIRHPRGKPALGDLNPESLETMEIDVPEPVAIVAEIHMSRYTIEWTNGDLPEGTKLYTNPPQRTWVGLTGEEVKNFVQAVWPREATPADYIRAIEAKLKEKNT
jgi:hypothetical protein